MAVPSEKLYGVTNSLILSDYLPQWQVNNANQPGTDIIDNKIDIAAADFDEALTEGGYSASSIDATDTPIAYERARDLIATRAALLYASAIGHVFPADDTSMAKNDEQLDRIRDGKPFGDLSITGGPRQGLFVHGTDTRTQVNDRRAKVIDPL